MVFANLSTETQALAITVATMVGGAITWGVTRAYDWNRQRHKDKLEEEDRKRKFTREDTDRIVEHLEELIERGEKLRLEMRDDYRILEQEFRVTERLAERAVAWILHLEERLDTHKIPHPKWKDVVSVGSHEHRPLPPTTPEQSKAGG